MAIDSGQYRTIHSVATLVGVEVLVIDADQGVHAGLEQLLSEANLHVTCVTDPQRGLSLVEKQFYSVALVDLDTPTPDAGIETIGKIHAKSPTTMVIAMTPRRSFDDAVAAVRAGAVDLILKAPESVAYLKDRVLNAAGRSVGKREVDTVLDEIRRVHDEFLNRTMEIERRATDLADKVAGRDDSRMIQIDDMRVLVIDEVEELYDALTEAKPRGFSFVYANSGGEGLDRVSTGPFNYVMIAEDISDLPARTVARTVRNQHPDCVVLTFRGPAQNGFVDLVEQNSTRTIVKPFSDATQLLARMDDLSEAWRAKARERRYTQLFRERHYDFLRRYVELKTKIERAMNDGPG